MTIFDTPEAALEEAVWEANKALCLGESVDWTDMFAAAILAAMPDWTLVPKEEDEFLRYWRKINEDGAEIARLRVALEKFLSAHYANNGDGRTSHLTWTIPEKAFGDLRYALDARPSDPGASSR
jgi:hypothetical protein